ncbi:MAG: hypothetical protein GKR98_15445 [Boseongicola sp.]|nr:MAG: hypothetical protein GKR98_15445 [Boseongicola sp.]
MKYPMLISTTALVTVLAAHGASAACYADYKAKQENPLRLHYGVVQVDANPCQMSGAVRKSVANRVAAGGWKVLQVQSVFDESGLDAKKRDAGEYFLRF